MKKLIKIVIFIFMFGFLFQTCKDYLDPYEYAILSRDKTYMISTYVNNIPFAIYSRLPHTTGVGMTSASDESENVNPNDNSQEFNKGTWHEQSSGDNIWSSAYKGIRTACDYLDGTDTLTWSQFASANRSVYLAKIRSLCIGRAEARFLQAYLYFELMRRYGEVPLITERLDIVPNMDYSQFHLAPVSDVVDYISDQCDIVTSEGKYKLTLNQIEVLTANGTKLLQVPYRDTLSTLYDLTGINSAELGRATKAAAYALKAKTLIYYASKQFNPNNDLLRWKSAAVACKKVLDLPASHYGLEANYKDIFNRKNAWSKEFIFVRKTGPSQTFEISNYPIAINRGTTGVCPSQDLIDSYELIVDATTAVPFDWENPAHIAKPYVNRDPRLAATVYVNDEMFHTASPNNMTLQMWSGGNCDPAKYLASKTGYYLKKYIDPALDLSKTSSTSAKTWVLMRLADFYLFYAEAMNEVYGPDEDPEGLGLTARQAVNKVRTRAGMPDIYATNQIEFRERIRNERRVELAFENHRWFDVRRWVEGDRYFNGELHGVEISKDGSTFNYKRFVIENRVYDQEKMKFYRISEAELRRMGKIMSEDTPGTTL